MALCYCALGSYSGSQGNNNRAVGQQVEIRVRDNSMGMSPEVHTEIFQPFFTTRPTGGGTGLGLSLSYDSITLGVLLSQGWAGYS